MGTVAASANIVSLARDLAAASGQTIERSAAALIAESGQRIAEEARAKAPLKTGKLASSIHVRYRSPLSVEVGPTVEYGAFQEFGTATRGEFPGPMYEIRPKRPDGRLVFKINGKTVVTKLVKHPGVKPQPYMRPAFEHVLERFMGRLMEEGAAQITKGPAA